MDLGDRGRGDGLVVESVEQLVEWPVELRLDGRARDGAGKRWQTILQPRQIGRDIVSDQVRAHGERLAELDECGPQRLQRQRQPLARPFVPDGLNSARAGKPDGDREDPGRAQNLEREQGIVTGQRSRDRPHAAEIAKRAPHRRQTRHAECSATMPPVRLAWLTLPNPALRNSADSAS